MSKVAYQFPFDSYQAWLGFMDKAPDSAWHSSKMRALIPESTFNAYKQQKTITIERIQYFSDELLINGFLIKPKHVKTPLPMVLYAHGGVGKWGRITFFDVLELSRLAERGYIVIASTLRGEMGSEGKPNLGKGDRQDMLSLLTLAKKLEGTDTDNIGLWGFSRGGGLGYRVIASTDQIKTAVLVGASSDLVNSPRRDEFHTHVYPGIVDNYESNQDLALRELSAIYWPERLHPKTSILLLHGSEDNRVSVLGSQAMSRKLTLLNRPHKYVEIIGGSHTLIENLQQVRSEIDDWFDTHLKFN
jgi:dipeptidyl aminopeptidase/acylaminoacyl peptidase